MSIKELREKLEMTQTEFALKLGVAEYTVRRWESGTSKPSPLAQRQLEMLEKKVGKK